MRAFWWFKENSIAGMARPGFNQIRWFDMPFDEAVVMGWIGQHSTGAIDRNLFYQHLETYMPKILKFYKLTPEGFSKAKDSFFNDESLAEILNRISERTQFIKDVVVHSGKIQFRINENRMEYEIDCLKKHGISRIICLAETHHDKNYLENHFNLHHFAIEDLSTPKMDQVRQLAEIIDEAQLKNEKIAVHCLAGIGRTSTMLMASCLLKGESLENLVNHVSQRNPSYVLTDSQNDFLRNVKNYL